MVEKHYGILSLRTLLTPVTYDDFEAYGIHRHCIKDAIAELVALGFIEVTHAGRAGNAEYRAPNIFDLTYVTPTGNRQHTNGVALKRLRKLRCYRQWRDADP